MLNFLTFLSKFCFLCISDEIEKIRKDNLQFHSEVNKWQYSLIKVLPKSYVYKFLKIAFAPDNVGEDYTSPEPLTQVQFSLMIIELLY